MTEKKTYAVWAIYKRVFQQIRPHCLALTVLLVISGLSALVTLLVPLPLKIIVDSVLGSQPLPYFLDPIVPSSMSISPRAILWLAVVLVLVIALLDRLLGLGSWILGEYLGEKIVLEFRSKLFEHVTQLSLSQHDTRGHGDLIYRIQYDAPAIRWLVLDGALPLLTAFLTLLAMVYVIARVELTLGLIALVVVPIIFFLTRVYGRRLRPVWLRVKVAETDALSVVQEVIGAIRVVKAFGQENREQKRLFDMARRSIIERIRVIIAEGQFTLLVGMTIALGTAALLMIGTKAVWAEQLTTGDLVLVISLNFMHPYRQSHSG
jgi:ATP-binding cassette subfamily B protein